MPARHGRFSVVATLLAALGAPLSAAQAQDENPTTPGAIPNPGTYQGSMELQRREDQQDEAFRRQQQQQQQEYAPPQASPQTSYGVGRRPATGRPPAYVPRVMPDFAANRAAGDALERGDAVTALRILKPLAQRGDMVAEYQMGVLYDRGAGPPTKYATARQYYLKSAEQGFAAAMYNLGVMYGLGHGAPVDNIEAYRWFALAIARLNSPQQTGQRQEAIHNRDLVAAKMSKPQVARAQTLARATQLPVIR